MLSEIPIANLVVVFSILCAVLLVVISCIIWYVRTPGPKPGNVASIRDRLQTDEAKEQFDQLSRENEEIKQDG